MSKTRRAIGTATAGTSSLSRETTSGALSPRDLRRFRVSHLPGSGTTPEKPYQNRPALLKGPCEGFCVEREACC